MPLAAGETLGVYEILSSLGAGGMGEVYRARDTKLGREVAVKVLPDEFAEHPEKLARFEREARLLAGLNHSGIATLYGVEQQNGRLLLAMELCEGETLAERLARGPLPAEEALPIALQIAEALEAAHEKGVVHRDLKPANIKIDPDSRVKVLDFGLAKALLPEEPESDMSQSPTLSHDTTRAGVILGTAAYMSPEQAKGKAVDRRTDIFSFGVVLFEMLSGKKAFVGDDVSEVLASILKLEPDWTLLPPDLDPRIGVLVRRCLEKAPRRRRQSMGDVRVDLEVLTEVPFAPVPATTDHRPVSARGSSLLIAAGAVAGGLLGVAGQNLLRPAETRRVARLTIAPPAGQVLLPAFRSPVLALSPDGSRAVYRVRADGEAALVVRALDSLERSVLYRGSASVPSSLPTGRGWASTTRAIARSSGSRSPEAPR